MNQTHDRPNVIVDTLRASERELQELIAKLAASDNGMRPGDTAARPRTAAATDLPRVLVQICHLRGNCNIYLVKPRDVHANGIVFLHGSFVHEGAKCTVLLRTCDGLPAQIPAAVFRCRHIAGRIHELVAVFDRAIVIQDFMFPDGTPLTAGAAVGAGR